MLGSARPPDTDSSVPHHLKMAFSHFADEKTQIHRHKVAPFPLGCVYLLFVRHPRCTLDSAYNCQTKASEGLLGGHRVPGPPTSHLASPPHYTVWDLNTPAHTPRPTQAGCPTSQLKAISSRKPSHRFPCAMKDSIAPQALQILLPWPQSQPSFQVDLTVLGSHQPLPTGLWTPRPRS